MWAVIFIAWVYTYISLLLKPQNRRGVWRAAVSELVWALESGVGEVDWANIGLGTQPPDPQVASMIRVS